ncbi:maleylpyruvate isomerase family mycothiol-dependent enzyme [Actinocrispum wychmicini]|nr:maleylpyruvate isomerase family mycothiol-dependent enzyme [Actinocrispum wychmicini]
MTTITEQRTELADTLDGLSPAQWDAPTLCEGWRVREVAAHMTMPFRYKPGRIMLEMLKSGGSFTRMSDRRAKADAARLSAQDLAGTIRENLAHPWRPPGGGLEAALSHDVIHSLDFVVPLGLPWRIPADRLLIVLHGLSPKRAKYFGVDLTGVRLSATDADWTYGSGKEVTGTLQDLVLYVCGRKTPTIRMLG